MPRQCWVSLPIALSEILFLPAKYWFKYHWQATWTWGYCLFVCLLMWFQWDVLTKACWRRNLEFTPGSVVRASRTRKGLSSEDLEFLFSSVKLFWIRNSLHLKWEKLTNIFLENFIANCLYHWIQENHSAHFRAKEGNDCLKPFLIICPQIGKKVQSPANEKTRTVLKVFQF